MTILYFCMNYPFKSPFELHEYINSINYFNSSVSVSASRAYHRPVPGISTRVAPPRVWRRKRTLGNQTAGGADAAALPRASLRRQTAVKLKGNCAK